MVSQIHIAYVEPPHLHQTWPLLRIGLEDIIRKTQPDWLPEDMYAQLAEQKASAYLVQYQDVTVGWFIICEMIRPFNFKKDLLIWAGWSMPVRERQKRGVETQGLALDIEQAVFTFCENLARQHQYAAVAFLSPRAGMRKRAEQWGFRERSTRYEKAMR